MIILTILITCLLDIVRRNSVLVTHKSERFKPVKLIWSVFQAFITWWLYYVSTQCETKFVSVSVWLPMMSVRLMLILPLFLPIGWWTQACRLWSCQSFWHSCPLLLSRGNFMWISLLWIILSPLMQCLCISLWSGGNIMVPSSRCPHGGKALLHIHRHVVCWLYFCRSDLSCFAFLGDTCLVKMYECFTLQCFLAIKQLTLSLQDLISNSPHCLLYNFQDVSTENLVLDQPIIPQSTFFFILVTSCLLGIVLILWGRNLS